MKYKVQQKSIKKQIRKFGFNEWKCVLKLRFNEFWTRNIIYHGELAAASCWLTDERFTKLWRGWCGGHATRLKADLFPATRFKADLFPATRFKLTYFPPLVVHIVSHFPSSDIYIFVICFLTICANLILNVKSFSQWTICSIHHAPHRGF